MNKKSKILEIEELTTPPEDSLDIAGRNILGHISLAEIGRLYNYKGEEVEFFKAQILVKGLIDFHITTIPNITDDQKRECVKETIETWDKGRIRITEL